MAIIQSGSFTANGSAQVIRIRSDFDMIRVLNFNAGAQATDDLGYEFYFQRGMTNGRGMLYTKLGNTEANNTVTFGEIAANAGFTILDTSGSPLAALNAVGGANEITAISNAAIPVATNSGANGLVAGDVVRLYTVTNAGQLNGFDFTVGYNTLSGTTFSLDYMSQLAVAGTTAAWRKIKWDPIYYPRHRYITSITSSGSSSVIKLSVTHGYKVGQLVRVLVPAIYDMVEMDNLVGTITAIDTTPTSGNTITVDIDSSSFTAFAFPSAADYAAAGSAFSKAMVVPIGMDTAEALSASVNELSDATFNDGFIGVSLAAGTLSPAGQNNDVIYYEAIKNDITVNP